MRPPVACLFASMVAVAPALAAPGVTTTGVNLRAGPGTDNQSLGVLPSGTPVEIDACEPSGWCSVTGDGAAG